MTANPPRLEAVKFAPQAEPAAAAPSMAAPAVYKVELDERALLFPDGKIVNHIMIAFEPPGAIHLDCIFQFNKAHQPPRIASFTVDEAREFAKELVNAVYRARTSFVLSETLKVNINVITNGYQIEISRWNQTTELFLSTSVIWRFIKGLLMTLDEASPVRSN